MTWAASVSQECLRDNPATEVLLQKQSSERKGERGKRRGIFRVLRWRRCCTRLLGGRLILSLRLWLLFYRCGRCWQRSPHRLQTTCEAHMMCSPMQPVQVRAEVQFRKKQQNLLTGLSAGFWKHGRRVTAMFSNLSAGRKQNSPDADFGCMFFFVSDAAHSCWITGFNRLLLCSIVFQILPRVFRTCCSLCRLKNLIPKHRLAFFGNKTLISIARQIDRGIMSSRMLLFLMSDRFSNVPYHCSFRACMRIDLLWSLKTFGEKRNTSFVGVVILTVNYPIHAQLLVAQLTVNAGLTRAWWSQCEGSTGWTRVWGCFSFKTCMIRQIDPMCEAECVHLLINNLLLAKNIIVY